MIHSFLRRRSIRHRQRLLAFVERAMRRERWFKRAIALLTLLVLVMLVTVPPWGLHLSASIDAWAKRIFGVALRTNRSRAEIDEDWRTFREAGIKETRPRVRRAFADCEPAYQHLLRYAGMDPDHGLLRWANYDWTILLSSKVFEADDQGRSYRLRPLTRSVWLRKVAIASGMPAFFLVPDGPGLAEASRGTTAVALESSRQTTNSWGLRGPEPEPDAPLRGLILGDSFMQGMFIGDDETPPECLRRDLQARMKTRVSILNTGVMGYSPEQYYYTLIAFLDRFRPHFVVVSLCANDFGNTYESASRGVGDWPEARYWLKKIVQTCSARLTPCVIVPAPVEANLLKRRTSGYYPGILINTMDVEPQVFLDPMDDFLDAHLQARIECRRNGGVPTGCTLFNDAINDTHFSPAGSEVWARSVGRRVAAILEDAGLGREPGQPTSRVDRPADDPHGRGEKRS